MIELEIIHCPNNDFLGTYRIFKDLFHIGSNLSAELRVKDNAIMANHLIIDIEEDRLRATLNLDDGFFLVDGKRTTSLKYLNIGSSFEVGNTRFLVKQFSAQKIVTKRETLNKNTDELIKEKSPLLSYIKKLQTEL
ncbi:MAG: hypothetical protein KC478_05520 [Bacteriovoracaceae bacterium]|nr:hypothetical protein [Bacteriovoracaceae bacterium]